jgi:type I restriction enzyme R subunit
VLSERVRQELYREKMTHERWFEILRGQYSRSIPGESTHQTIRLIDFLEPSNNRFTVTNQLYVKSEHPRIADLVIYVNGIPLVVIEAKKPGSGKLKSAFEQIKQYEEQIPRLFHSNAFSLVTDRHELQFGTTGAPWTYWGAWKDPWPRDADEFSGAFDRGLWALLEPSRLLDILAHFIVFEREEDTGRVVKKMCRYQQYRAGCKIVERARDPELDRGLIWHTQGSGKSLTMVFSVLKLKMHRTLEDPRLANPSILVITDRKDLHRQITATFQACGLPNPHPAESIKHLHRLIRSGAKGQTVLSTIHKFEGSETPVPNSEEWIVLADEAHRSQEKDLGAFLRATFPDACLFGFTGTPVKKRDLNTFRNFSPEDEGYLDLYSIDDAVRDGATVPIYYESRLARVELDEDEKPKIDAEVAELTEEDALDEQEKLKRKWSSIEALVGSQKRLGLVAQDLVQHYEDRVQAMAG